MIELFLSAFVSLFVIQDPIGTAVVFSGLTARQTRQQRMALALRATIIATGILLAFGVGGEALLGLTGISLDAFRIAGGLLLFVTAFRMIMDGPSTDTIDESKEEMAGHSYMDMAVFPLAIPLLSGPGCMTATILYMSQAETLTEKSLIAVVILLTGIIAFTCMVGASHLTALVGRTGTSLISRLMGVLLAALSVQFVADGVRALF